MKVKSEREVTQLHPTLSDPMDCSLAGSSIHGIFQARVQEWGVIAFSDLTLQITVVQLTQSVKSQPAMQETKETWVQSLGQEDPRRRKWQLDPVFFPKKSHGHRNLAGYSPRDHRESDMTEKILLDLENPMDRGAW